MRPDKRLEGDAVAPTLHLRFNRKGRQPMIDKRWRLSK
jgi:hypothetical protein